MINELDVELGARGYREEEIGTDLSTSTLAGVHQPLRDSELDVELGVLDHLRGGVWHWPGYAS